MSVLSENVQTTAIFTVTDAPVLVIPLSSEGVLTLQGPDAHKFLQGQSTTDVNQVTAHCSRLGSLANLKGRAIVSFRAVEWQEQTLHLLMDAPLVAKAQALLQKYIVFSKAKLSTPDIALIGVVGEQAAALLSRIFGVCPANTDDCVGTAQAAIVRVHGDHRFIVLVDRAQHAGIWSQLTAEATVGGLNQWRLAQIAAGETQVLADTSELYQPQELNLPSLNGVSYNKGCYTGQEIIARLHFRGKLKQWSHRFVAATGVVPALNSVLYDADGQSQGHVVLAAQRDKQTVELLALVRHDHKDSVVLGAERCPLQCLPLPYIVEVKE